jgi:predicted PurR-regulated permease PerM
MVPNALFFTLLASLAGILPVIGTTLVWLPMAIYLLASGNTISAIGVTAFGLISSSIDNFLRPVIVSRKTKMHPAIVLVGMIGGLFFFGVLGFILGPLILAYLIILLEVYKNKRSSIVFIKENNKTR